MRLRSDLGITWQMQTFGITRGAVQVASLEACSGELDVKIRALRREGRLIADLDMMMPKMGILSLNASASRRPRGCRQLPYPDSLYY